VVNPLDIAIATAVNKDLKFCVTTCIKSAVEASTPELRQVFTQIATDGVRRQEQLVRMSESKGWYVAPPADQQMINQLAPQLQAAIRGIEGIGVGAGAPAGTINPASPRI
jgi:spore coat protein CotF